MKYDYEIGIITRGRAGKVTTFKATGLPLGRFTLFTDTEEEAEEYREAHPDVKVISTNTKYVNNARNKMLDIYGAGSRVVMMCDDVEKIVQLAGSKSLRTLSAEEIDGVIRRGFEACKKYEVGLWGVYPIANHFFMKRRINTKGFIIGTFCGVVVSDIRMDAELILKEDYDFTLRHIIRDKKVIRFDDVAVKAKHYTNKGGCVDMRTPEIEQKCIARLEQLYPGLIRRNPKRENEILLSI